MLQVCVQAFTHFLSSFTRNKLRALVRRLTQQVNWRSWTFSLFWFLSLQMKRFEYKPAFSWPFLSLCSSFSNKKKWWNETLHYNGNLKKQDGDLYLYFYENESTYLLREREKKDNGWGGFYHWCSAAMSVWQEKRNCLQNRKSTAAPGRVTAQQKLSRVWLNTVTSHITWISACPAPPLTDCCPITQSPRCQKDTSRDSLIHFSHCFP